MGKDRFFEGIEVEEKVTLDEIARLGAQTMLRTALRAEIAVYMEDVSGSFSRRLTPPVSGPIQAVSYLVESSSNQQHE